MISKHSKDRKSKVQNSRPAPTVKIQPQVDSDFDNEVDQDVDLHAPQVDDYQTMVPLSGEGPEVPVEPKESRKSSEVEEITADDIAYMLSRHPEIDASDIIVRVNKGEVILTGSVPEERMKFMTAEVIKLIHGVKSVNNQLKHMPSH